MTWTRPILVCLVVVAACGRDPLLVPGADDPWAPSFDAGAGESGDSAPGRADGSSNAGGRGGPGPIGGPGPGAPGRIDASVDGDPQGPPGAPTLVVRPNHPATSVKQPVTFVAAVVSSADTVDVSFAVRWSVRDTALGTIDARGVYTPLRAGTNEVRADLQAPIMGVVTLQARTTIRAVDAVVDGGAPAPRTLKLYVIPGGPLTLNVDQRIAFQVDAYFPDGPAMPVAVTNQAQLTSQNPGVVRVEAGTLVRAVAAGSTTVTISYGGARGTVAIMVR